MMNNKDNAPFYKELFYKIENELGPIDTITGLALGLGVGMVSCVAYWIHAYKYH